MQWRMTTRLALLSLFLLACESSTTPVSGDGSPPGGDATPAADGAPGGSDGGSGGAQLGSVSELDDPCPDGAGPLPGTRCIQVEVSCPDIPSLVAQLRITDPPSDATPRGTILFGTGGGGESFYDGSATAEVMMRSLAGDGFTIVQRAWISQWESGGAGLAAAACRYATLLTWVKDEIHQDGALCATGNSGGSAEIGYALSRFGREAILDLAVPTGGPVMSRVDLGCLPSDGWQAQCETVPDGTACEPAAVQCDYAGSNFGHIDGAYLPDTPCELHDAAFADQLLADSILSPDADVDFTTPVHQLLGERDCSPALPQGVLWYDALVSAKTRTFVADTGHSTFATEEGASAIRRVLDEECVPR